jgi:ribosome biogenesis protein
MENKLTKENFPKEIEIKFVTNTYPEKVTETPFKVPSELSRYGLSEIINHLLDHSKFFS